jgi:hypothetical protein
LVGHGGSGTGTLIKGLLLFLVQAFLGEFEHTGNLDDFLLLGFRHVGPILLGGQDTALFELGEFDGLLEEQFP